MFRELEEFLRMAAEQARKQAQAQEQARRPAGPRPRPQPPPRPAGAARPPLRATDEVAILGDADVIEADLADEGVAEHVAKHLNTRAFEQRASHLGEEVGRADDVLEARLHERFDHTVGTIGQRPKPARPGAAKPLSSPPVSLPAISDVAPVTVETPPSAIAADIARMLASPLTARQALVLTEVFQRPEARWS